MRALRIVPAALLLGAALALPARADDTLYAELGGGAGIARIVDLSVAAWLSDPRTKDDFDNINLDRFKAG